MRWSVRAVVGFRARGLGPAETSRTWGDNVGGAVFAVLARLLAAVSVIRAQLVVEEHDDESWRGLVRAAADEGVSMVASRMGGATWASSSVDAIPVGIRAGVVGCLPAHLCGGRGWPQA